MIGSVKRPFWEYIIDFFHKTNSKLNHIWNVVKIGDQWQLVDPTWTSIIKTEKLYYYNSRTKKNEFIKIKHVDRTYYNPTNVFMMKTHSPINPAFLLIENVPTFKTIRKKTKKQKIKYQNFNYTSIIDSIYNSIYPMFSNINYKTSKEYSKVNDLIYYYDFLISFNKQKRSKINPITIKECDSVKNQINNITEYIRIENGVDFSSKYIEFEKEIEKLKLKLSKQKSPKTQ